MTLSVILFILRSSPEGCVYLSDAEEDILQE